MKKILIVEDEKIMSTFILSSLRRLGILDLYAFNNGASALPELATLKPDLIITDVHMQPMGGIEFVRNIRASAHSQIANTPVIFLSADSSATTVGEALPLGVSGYIVKPPSLAALDAKIELALNGHKSSK